MRKFGLIGKKLSHSFSAQYFAEKFYKEVISDARYDLYEIDNPAEVIILVKKYPEILGLNVTIPFKETVIPFLNEVSDEVQEIGAVNCIKINRNANQITLKGYNTDVFGFEISLLKHLQKHQTSALIFGNGGSSKAVQFVLKKHEIEFNVVSRNPKNDTEILFSNLTREQIEAHQILINTTPVGMYPNIDGSLEIPFEGIHKTHLVIDLIYNPESTKFLEKAIAKGAKTVNGLEMLYAQAEKSWEIWNSIS